MLVQRARRDDPGRHVRVVPESEYDRGTDRCASRGHEEPAAGGPKSWRAEDVGTNARRQEERELKASDEDQADAGRDHGGDPGRARVDERCNSNEHRGEHEGIGVGLTEQSGRERPRRNEHGKRSREQRAAGADANAPREKVGGIHSGGERQSSRAPGSSGRKGLRCEAARTAPSPAGRSTRRCLPGESSRLGCVRTSRGRCPGRGPRRGTRLGSTAGCGSAARPQTAGAPRRTRSRRGTTSASALEQQCGPRFQCRPRAG